MINRYFLIFSVVLQLACGTFFVAPIFLDILGIKTHPIPWDLRELLEIGSAIGLFLGGALSLTLLLRTLRRAAEVEDRLRIASGAFAELIEDRMREWNLTPAERDVALFSIKGMSTPEIAALRNTSEGTVKAQTNAIYRKAGVKGRHQLISYFMEDLMHEMPLAQVGAQDDPSRMNAAARVGTPRGESRA